MPAIAPPSNAPVYPMRPSQQALDGALVRACAGMADLAETYPLRLANGAQCALGGALVAPWMGGVTLATGVTILLLGGPMIAMSLLPFARADHAPNTSLVCASVALAGVGGTALGAAALAAWPATMAAGAVLGAATGFCADPNPGQAL